jgi:hypothetical protein
LALAVEHSGGELGIAVQVRHGDPNPPAVSLHPLLHHRRAIPAK